MIFYLLTSTVGGILGGAYRTVTSALGNVAQTVGSTAQTAAQVAAPNLSGVTDPFSSIEQSVRGATGGNDPAALRDAAVTAVRAALTGNQQQAQEARERAAQALARAQNIPVEQARTAGPAVRAAVPPDGRPGQAAGDAGGRYRSQGRLARCAVRRARPSARRAGGWFGGRMGAVEPTITARMGLGPAARPPSELPHGDEAGPPTDSRTPHS